MKTINNQLTSSMMNLLKEQILETIYFIGNNCTADDFSWLSEIFDEIVEKTKSKDFIDCIKETAKKFPEECSKYNIRGSIESAEGYL